MELPPLVRAHKEDKEKKINLASGKSPDHFLPLSRCAHKRKHSMSDKLISGTHERSVRVPGMAATKRRMPPRDMRTSNGLNSPLDAMKLR
ncbi:hypothetical protein RRG08_023266 [Elysia crispata]|uniref:Uncharacterized protein n=1 Tax=Elysia crispata TaxID=231223 RepID=A0AAE1CKC7_9GAST|nr:hypothetical protein RRG08_023266 [Elysia crispata]